MYVLKRPFAYVAATEMALEPRAESRDVMRPDIDEIPVPCRGTSIRFQPVATGVDADGRLYAVRSLL
jgi:hypothetical protein